MRALYFLALFLVIPLSASSQVADLQNIYEGGPAAPVVVSSDYPDENSWYRPIDATFTWSVPEPVTAVAVEVTASPDAEPMESYRPPVPEVSISANEWLEGIQYVTVQFKNSDKWGPYTARRVMIDGTTPEPFMAEVSVHEGEGRGVIVKAEATDRLSGLSHYEISMNGRTAVKATREELRSGYFIALDHEGSNLLSISAVDRAGNARVFSTPILSLPAKTIDITDDPFAYAASEPASILVSIMAGIMLLTFGYLVYERQRYAYALSSLRDETDEVQEQMLRVFTALREEIYDQIGAINRKSRLTKKEKEAVDGLNKALAVSEKLLKKEVKDVKKLLN